MTLNKKIQKLVSENRFDLAVWTILQMLMKKDKENSQYLLYGYAAPYVFAKGDCILPFIEHGLKLLRRCDIE